MRQLILLVLLAFPLAGCAQGFSTDKNYDLRLGQQTQVGDYILIFQEVEEDSRCPKGTDCIWAGRAIVKVSVVTPGKQPREHKAIFGQTKGDEKANTIVVQDGSYVIELKALKPYPEAEKKMGPYVLKLVERS